MSFGLDKCKYNNFVECSTKTCSDECASCGWNPAVHAERCKRISTNIAYNVIMQVSTIDSSGKRVSLRPRTLRRYVQYAIDAISIMEEYAKNDYDGSNKWSASITGKRTEKQILLISEDDNNPEAHRYYIEEVEYHDDEW